MGKVKDYRDGFSEWLNKRGTPDGPQVGPDRDAIISVLKWFARGEISQGAAADAIINLCLDQQERETT